MDQVQLEAIAIVHHPRNSVFQQSGMKIDDQPKSQIRQTQIAQKPGVIELGDVFFGFQINNYFFFDDQIQAERHTKPHTLVMNRHLLLPLEPNAAQTELVA